MNNLVARDVMTPKRRRRIVRLHLWVGEWGGDWVCKPRGCLQGGVRALGSKYQQGSLCALILGSARRCWPYSGWLLVAFVRFGKCWRRVQKAWSWLNLQTFRLHPWARVGLDQIWEAVKLWMGLVSLGLLCIPHHFPHCRLGSRHWCGSLYPRYPAFLYS